MGPGGPGKREQAKFPGKATTVAVPVWQLYVRGSSIPQGQVSDRTD